MCEDKEAVVLGRGQQGEEKQSQTCRTLQAIKSMAALRKNYLSRFYSYAILVKTQLGQVLHRCVTQSSLYLTAITLLYHVCGEKGVGM